MHRRVRDQSQALPREVVNGTELTSVAILTWCAASGVTWHYIAPGKPQAERLRRELHRSAAGRVPELDAPNGKTVLDLLAKGPDLIILDLGLPDVVFPWSAMLNA